jgi:hypothetical protein
MADRCRDHTALATAPPIASSCHPGLRAEVQGRHATMAESGHPWTPDRVGGDKLWSWEGQRLLAPAAEEDRQQGLQTWT